MCSDDRRDRIYLPTVVSYGAGMVAPRVAAGPYQTVCIAAAPQAIAAGRTITLTALTDSAQPPPASYAWSFGDGQTAAGALPQVTHTYPAAGRWTVTVTVADAAGQTAQARLAVTTGAATLPPLRVAGNRILAGDQAVVLRGVAIPDLEYLTRYRPGGIVAMIDRVVRDEGRPHSLHTRILRLPVYAAPQGLPIQGWLADPDRYMTTYLQPAVQHCVSKNVYCIIDWHWISDYHTGNAPIASVHAATLAFWDTVAGEYAGNPQIIFEVFNEPMFPDDWGRWRTTAQPWIDAIRRRAPENLIIVGAPHWSRHTAGAILNPFAGDNLAYAAHIYPGHTSDPAETPLSQEQYWDAWFGGTAAVRPVLVTEWGWERCHADCADFPELDGTAGSFGHPFKAYIEGHGDQPGHPVAGWTAWVADYCLGPRLFNDDWSLAGGDPEEADEYHGAFVRAWLAEANTDAFPAAVGTVPGMPAFADGETDPACGLPATGSAAPGQEGMRPHR